MTQQTETPRNLINAPAPGGNFVKVPIGTTVKGVLDRAEVELVKKSNKKGKLEETERHIFALALAESATLEVGKKKKLKPKDFAAGEIVILPDHGFLTNTLRRTACKLAGVSYDAKADTDLSPLLGRYFEITRLEDGEISSGPWAGQSSALYDVKYGA